MSPKALLFIAASAIGAAMVAAQAAPQWRYIPAACSSQCATTAQVSYLCENQYSGDYTSIYGCYCSSFPSDAAACSTCLTANNAAALGSLVSSTITACPQAVKSCFFQCSFDTCPPSDIACQCSASYLQSIYNCGSCNTANNNVGSTQLADWQSLQKSCAAQKYAGASGNFATTPLASPTGQAAYTPVALTAAGGGAAATGAINAIGVSAPAPGVIGASPTGAAAVNNAGVAAGAAGAAGASGASAAVATGSAAVVGGAAPATLAGAAGSASVRVSSAAGAGASGGISAATASKAAADNLAIPATGLLAVLGAVAALL